MIPDSLDFILRPVDEQQAEYAAAHQPCRSVQCAHCWPSLADDFNAARAHQTTVPAEEGEADAGTVKSSASPDLPQGGADTDSSDADTVGVLASEDQTSAGPAWTAIRPSGAALRKPDREAEVDASACGNDDRESRRKLAPVPLLSSPLGPASTPRWSAVDDDTADLLSLVASTEAATLEPQRQWEHFLKVLKLVAAETGCIDQNRVRPLLAGEVSSARVGAFWRRAALEGLVRPDGWNESDHVESRNAGRPQKTYRWLGGGGRHAR